MYWNGKPIDATDEYQTALVGYPLACIQLIAPSGSYPRSSRSNTRSVSIGGLVNVNPSNERSVCSCQPGPMRAWPLLPVGCALGHSTSPCCCASCACCVGDVYVKVATALAGLDT